MTTGRINQVGTFSPSEVDRSTTEKREIPAPKRPGRRCHEQVRSTATGRTSARKPLCFEPSSSVPSEPPSIRRFTSAAVTRPPKTTGVCDRGDVRTRARRSRSREDRAQSRTTALEPPSNPQTFRTKNLPHRVLVRASSSTLDRAAEIHPPGELNDSSF